MRKFLKEIRKGLRTACVTTALATCWNVGQLTAHAAYQNGQEVTVRFSGTISATTDDLSHVFLIYGTGYSSVDYELRSVELGDFVGGQQGHFSVDAEVQYNATLWWYVAGLHGDVSEGQYIQNMNGVVLGIDATEGDSWEEAYSHSIDQSTAFLSLLNNQTESLPSFNWGWDGWYWDYLSGIEFDEMKKLYTFSAADESGEVHIQSQIIPEPVGILFLGAGGIIISGTIKRKKVRGKGDLCEKVS